MHTFTFQMGASFFEMVEDNEILDGDVRADIAMMREERMLDLHFTFSGTAIVSCDRCADPVSIPVEGTERLIVKLGDRYMEESEDVQIIPETDHQFDLAPFLYEYIHLLLPVRRTHPEDDNGASGCNPEVLKKLEELQPSPAPDPRWSALNKLKDNS